MIDTELDRPGVSSYADVTLVARGITVTALVERAEDEDLLVFPAGERDWSEIVRPGDKVEVYWASEAEERILPARVASTDHSETPRWLLAPTGPAARSQRRKAVRAYVALPVEMPWSGSVLKGTTIDLSEGGIKALVDGWGVPPEGGQRLLATVGLEADVDLEMPSEVVWTSEKAGGQWVIALRFDATEKDADVVRRRVFRALREDRARERD